MPYLPSDSSDSDDGGASLNDSNRNARTPSKSNRSGDNGIKPPRPLLECEDASSMPLGESLGRSGNPSTNEQAPDSPGPFELFQISSPDGSVSPQSFRSSNNISVPPNGKSFELVKASQAASMLDELDEETAPARQLDEARSHDMSTANTTTGQHRFSRYPRFAYVEDADTDDSSSHPDVSIPSTSTASPPRSQRYRAASDISRPGTRRTIPIPIPHQFGISTPTNDSYPYPRTTSSDGQEWTTYGSSEDEFSTAKEDQPSQPSTSIWTNTERRLRYRINYSQQMPQPRLTETPKSRWAQNPFTPITPNLSYRTRPAPYSYYGTGPDSNVLPPAPEPPVTYFKTEPMSHRPYEQYSGLDTRVGYSGYTQAPQDNIYDLTANTRPPPPPSTHIPGSPRKPRPLGPTSLNVTPKRHAADASYIPGVEIASSYKPPVSFDLARHDISFQVPFKSISVTDKPARDNHMMLNFMHDNDFSKHWDGTSNIKLRRDGESNLTRIRSLEHYANISGQDGIAMLRPHLRDGSGADGMRVMRWLCVLFLSRLNQHQAHQMLGISNKAHFVSTTSV